MSAEADRQAERAPANGRREPGSRILVIDDEEVIHVSLRRILVRQGHHVDAVLDAREGLSKLQGVAYDLVISDLMMPEVSGLDLLEQMQERGLQVPVLMITGYPSIRTAVEALRLGAVDYLAKPFTRRELLGPVNRTLRGGEGEEAQAMRETPSDADGFAEPELHLEPGARFHLRGHAWAVYQQDGIVKVGIETSFLENVGPIVAVELPEETDLVEQGFTGIRLRTASGEEHAVFMPLSGQITEVNPEALAMPAAITDEMCLVQMLPVNLDEELPRLLRG